MRLERIEKMGVEMIEILPQVSNLYHVHSAVMVMVSFCDVGNDRGVPAHKCINDE